MYVKYISSNLKVICTFRMTEEQAFIVDGIALWNGTVHGTGGTKQHDEF
jgi:hypothetical protein